ncbi:hypothetical protein [Streptomyces sp. NPDC056244]|uniref:hypothetical protein n=1 Tax=Streptomyces sp. NPDC056244 TaxID=3345762 RepID=UPI0035E0374A
MRITGLFTRPLTRALLTRTLLAGVLLSGTALFGTAGTALADETPVPATEESGNGDGPEAVGPTEAGTSFRTAAAFKPGQTASAEASTGDYLYWVFPADAGQRPTVRATVTLPESAAARKGALTWQVDVYDGLRRRQPCVSGAQTKAVAADADTVSLRCTLRTVRAWAEPWSDDPLPGSYYVRLTVVNAQEEDLGLPVRTEVEAATPGAGGAYAVGGKLSAPLTPGITEASSETAVTASEPKDGWSSGWWTDRWIWTVAGGVLGALAGIAGYTLARPSRRA